MPNILIVITDDQRYDAMEVMSKTQQRFGGEGTRYLNAFVTTPMCCPSRASIMTGRYAHNHEVLLNRDAEKLDLRSALQSYLDAAGYEVAFLGKFLNSWPISDEPPDMDRWAIFRDGYYDAKFNVSGSLLTIPRYSTRYIRSEAIRFIRQMEARDSRPWLLFVSVYAPHYPATAEERYRYADVPAWARTPAMDETDRSDKPGWVRNHRTGVAAIERIRRKQLRTLMSVDDMVGRLFNVMEDEGERNTLSFFLSDNGYLWGEHGLSGKGLPYTSSIRTPLYARWPGHIDAGAVEDRLVSNIDIVPTVLDAAGLEADSRWPVDGRSLLDGGARDHLLLEFWKLPRYFVPTWASILMRDRQYVEYYDDVGNRTYREYYDLVADPYQLTNLFDDGNSGNNPDVSSLVDRLRRDRRCAGTSGPDACP